MCTAWPITRSSLQSIINPYYTYTLQLDNSYMMYMCWFQLFIINIHFESSTSSRMHEHALTYAIHSDRDHTIIWHGMYAKKRERAFHMFHHVLCMFVAYYWCHLSPVVIFVYHSAAVPPLCNPSLISNMTIIPYIITIYTYDH